MTLALRVIVQGSLTEATGAYQSQWYTALKQAAVELQKMVQRTLRTQSNRYGENPSPPGSPPHRGRSKLIGSIEWQSTGPLTARVGTKLIYGRIQELGGTIVAKTAMTVPVSLEARKHLLAGGTARTFPRTLFRWQTNSGQTAYLAERKGKKLEVHFMLAKQVTLPPRPYLRPTAESAEFRDKLKRIFHDAVTVTRVRP